MWASTLRETSIIFALLITALRERLSPAKVLCAMVTIAGAAPRRLARS
ncbi:MAG: hypothetical protein AAFQ58_14740 [Pseudomonadota bacterium]